MPFPKPRTPEGSDDLHALRRVIEDIALQHQINLTDRSLNQRIIDGDTTVMDTTGIDPQLFEDISSMLRLLLRLEYSSSEDLGYSGLCRLWERHREILRRFCATGQMLPAISVAL